MNLLFHTIWAFVFMIVGAIFENQGVITRPAYWALFGWCGGVVGTFILFKCDY